MAGFFIDELPRQTNRVQKIYHPPMPYLSNMDITQVHLKIFLIDYWKASLELLDQKQHEQVDVSQVFDNHQGEKEAQKAIV